MSKPLSFNPEFIRGFHSVLAPSHNRMQHDESGYFTVADAEYTWLSYGLPEAERLAFEAKGYQEGVEHGKEFLDAYDEPYNDMRL